MSHWVKYENKTFENTNMKLLSKAMRTLGYGLDNTCKSIRNAWGESQCDCAITKNNKVLSLGFKKNDKNILELVGDFYGTGVDENTFLDKVAQQYQSERIQNVLKDNRWEIENVTKNKNNEIVINAYEFTF